MPDESDSPAFDSVAELLKWEAARAPITSCATRNAHGVHDERAARRALRKIFPAAPVRVTTKREAREYIRNLDGAQLATHDDLERLTSLAFVFGIDDLSPHTGRGRPRAKGYRHQQRVALLSWLYDRLIIKKGPRARVRCDPMILAAFHSEIRKKTPRKGIVRAIGLALELAGKSGKHDTITRHLKAAGKWPLKS